MKNSLLTILITISDSPFNIIIIDINYISEIQNTTVWTSSIIN